MYTSLYYDQLAEILVSPYAEHSFQNIPKYSFSAGLLNLCFPTAPE